MKITIKHYDEKMSVEINRDDLTFDEYFDLIKRMSISIYSEATWNEHFEIF